MSAGSAGRPPGPLQAAVARETGKRAHCALEVVRRHDGDLQAGGLLAGIGEGVHGPGRHGDRLARFQPATAPGVDDLDDAVDQLERLLRWMGVRSRTSAGLHLDERHHPGSAGLLGGLQERKRLA